MFTIIVITATYRIVIRTDARKLDLFQDGTLKKTYPIAVGKPSTPTPKGSFKIINKLRNPGGVFGTRWMGLSKPHYGIHGTNDDSSIGQAVTHGCIRLHNKDVEELFSLVPVGTAVNII